MTHTADLTGKTILLTGATSGIGKPTAHALARSGAELIIVGRDAERTAAAAQEVRAATGNAKVSSMLADLSSMASIRELAARFLAEHPKLDVLVNNAGAMHATRKTTVDGLEMTFATNHLAYFLLTNLLLAPLKASPAGRVVNVASNAHFRSALDFDDLQWERRKYSFITVYGTSKLANILFTFELARRLSTSKVTANCLHPGVVSTGFGRNDPGVMRFLVKLASPFLLTPEKGARTTIYLASSPEVEGVTGKYFDKCKPRASLPITHDEAVAKRLWDASAKLTRLEA